MGERAKGRNQLGSLTGVGRNGQGAGSLFGESGGKGNLLSVEETDAKAAKKRRKEKRRKEKQLKRAADEANRRRMGGEGMEGSRDPIMSSSIPIHQSEGAVEVEGFSGFNSQPIGGSMFAQEDYQTMTSNKNRVQLENVLSSSGSQLDMMNLSLENSRGEGGGGGGGRRWGTIVSDK